MVRKAYIILADGHVFEGKTFGALGCVTGEMVFTTGMVGYLETLTDPSYYGQIIVQTFPLIGNYGVIPSDFESASPHLQGYVVREYCDFPSNFRSQGTLDDFLKSNNVVGVYDVDTRAITKLIREAGVMNARILTFSGDSQTDQKVQEELEKALNEHTKDSYLKELASLDIPAAIPKVTGSAESISQSSEEVFKQSALYKAVPVTPEGQKVMDLEAAARKGKGKKVLLWDFGAKANIRRELQKRGLEVVTIKAQTTAEEIFAMNPDGIMLSNGPGDPSQNLDIIAQIKTVSDSGIPLFGICMGHQLLALARGAKTYKLKYGHRGGNQPVKELATGRVYISSQNHGYAVDNDTLPAGAQLGFVNANDGTCEGIIYTDIPAFSVQFHPEAASGPLDTNFLFDNFVELIQKNPSDKRK